MAAPAQDTTVMESAAVDDQASASNLQESQYEVQVQLSDLQQDTDHPLASIASFDELGL